MTTEFSKEQAFEAVQAIIANRPSDSQLVSFDKFKAKTKLRSSRYKAFDVLCFKNTYKSTGWLVCQYVKCKGCDLSSGILRFNVRTGETGRLERHAKQHEVKNESRLYIERALPTTSKADIARAASLAVAFDLRPLSFTENKKGMRYFVDAVFKAGQQFPVSDVIDPSSILPSATSVTKAMHTIATQVRDEFRDLILKKMYETGGGVTTDEVTLKVQDRQLQDLTVHFIEVTDSGRMDVEPKVEMKVATLLLKEKPEAGDAVSIRAMLGSYLSQHYGKGIDWLTRRFTMVTDCASVMARVALSSVSANVAPMDEKWMGCLAHQLNTAMKSCMNSLPDGENVELRRIYDELQCVKKIVRIFKQSGWNGGLPNGYHLIQECETRFGTTLLVVQRFLKSGRLVKETIEKKNSVPAKTALGEILCEETAAGYLHMPALEAICDAFQVIVDAQTKVQAGNSPTVHLALPLLQNCRDELERIADGGSIWRDAEKDFVPSTRYSRKLCRCVLEWLEAKVKVHDLWLVGCFLHPYLREFQFVTGMEKRLEFKNRAENMLRSLIASYSDSLSIGNSSGSEPAVSANASAPGNPGDNRAEGSTVVGRKRTFCLMRFADSHFQPASIADEVSRYNIMDLSMLGIDKTKFMEDDFSVVKFWYKRKGTFPNIFKVVCRVYATPVSSCASERVFSALNRVVSRDRASTSAETLEDIIVIRSMVM